MAMLLLPEQKYGRYPIFRLDPLLYRIFILDLLCWLNATKQQQHIEDDRVGLHAPERKLRRVDILQVFAQTTP